MIGNGIGAGAKAFLASASITVESLPPEKRRHGRCISAATSRKMKMLSASRARRCGRTCDFTEAGQPRRTGEFGRVSTVSSPSDARPAAVRPRPPRRHRGRHVSGPGAVVYLTGLSGAGKSTIAEALAAELRADGQAVEIVDGDALRARDATPLGFDRASREAQVGRAAELAADTARTGTTVISALISPFEGARLQAREIIEASGASYFLVFVSTPLEVAEARDPKGHYKR